MHSPSPSRPAVPLLATLLLAALAGAGAAAGVTMLLRDAPRLDPAADAAVTVPADVLARLDDVERRLLRAEPATAAPASLAPAPAAVERTAADLERRLTALEQQVAELVARRNQRDSAGATAVATPPPTPDPQAEQRQREENQRRIATQQAVILDPRSDEKQKLTAWGQLRRLEDGWNDGVVATMTQIGLTSSDPEVRADVWRQADARAKHPSMASALLQAMSTDAHPKAREEAAETLAEYLTVAGVRQALEAASTNDPDEGVRRQATDSLRPRR